VGWCDTARFATGSKPPTSASEFLGNADASATKAVFLRTYSRHVTLLRLDDKPCSVQQSRELSEAGVRLPKAPVRALARQENQLIAFLSDGTQEVCDVIYPVLDCDVRSRMYGVASRRTQF
jgi:thioredoxin reductase (NADPH)